MEWSSTPNMVPIITNSLENNISLCTQVLCVRPSLHRCGIKTEKNWYVIYCVLYFWNNYPLTSMLYPLPPTPLSSLSTPVITPSSSLRFVLTLLLKHSMSEVLLLCSVLLSSPPSLSPPPPLSISLSPLSSCFAYVKHTSCLPPPPP